MSIGGVKFGSSLLRLLRGIEWDGAQNSVTMRRVEYAAVKRVARKKISRIRLFVGLNISISRIKSFE